MGASGLQRAGVTKALKRAEATLKKRSEQLAEAQRLGKLGDWSYHSYS